MVRDCAAGGLSPALAANVSNSGDTANVGTGVTVNVTGTGMGLLEAPGLSTMTVPEYVPAESPAGLAEMLIDLGDMPVVGFTLSQPSVLEAALLQQHEDVFRAAEVRAAFRRVARRERRKARERGQPAYQPEADETAAAQSEGSVPVHDRQ